MSEVTMEIIKTNHAQILRDNMRLQKENALLRARNQRLQARRNEQLAAKLRAQLGEDPTPDSERRWGYIEGLITGAWIIAVIYNLVMIL